MHIHFDLKNKHASVIIDSELFTCQLNPVKLSAAWSAAYMDNIVKDGHVYSVAWQVWQESIQYIQVREYQNHSKKAPWRTIARWTHSSDKTMKHFGCTGKVQVEGSPYGDFTCKSII